MKKFIKCSQVVTYYQQVELTDEQVAILEKVDGDDVDERHHKEEYYLIQSLINHSEVFDAEDEYKTFQLRAPEE